MPMKVAHLERHHQCSHTHGHLFQGKTLHISAKTTIKCILHLLHAGFIVEKVLNWPAWSPDLFGNLSIIMKRKIGHRQEDMGMTRIGQHSSPKDPVAGLTHYQMFIECCLKKRGCYTFLDVLLPSNTKLLNKIT